MKRILWVLILIAVLTIGCVACDSADDAFLKIEEKASGGEELPEQGMNIKDIDITYFNEQTELALHIVYGSREEIQNEAIITSLPKYEVFLLEEPHRLAVRLYGIDYVDYVQKNTWALDEHVVGVFRERIAVKEYTTVYFQLNSRVKFRVDEGDGKIRILLESDDAGKQNNHFVMLNAFDEYLEGAFDESYGLAPVLCADRVNIALISNPFDTAEKAEAARINIEAKLKNSPVNKTPYTMTLAGDYLPIINTDIDFFTPADKKVVMVDGVATTVPVLIENGRLIAENDTQKIYVKPNEDTDTFTDGEQLWVLRDGDSKTKMDLPSFTSVQYASFSPDGRYFGFVDVNIDLRVLYVYDFETSKLYNLGEEGFGVNTASFTWAEDQNAVFAITGNGPMRLAKCVFETDGLVFETISKELDTDGRMADFGDRIVLANNKAGEHGIIYAIYKQGGVKTFLCEGTDFRIAPDGASMAVIENRDYGEETGFVNLKIYSFIDKTETMVVEGGIVESFAFLPSFNTLLYTDGSRSDYTYRFKYALETYDLASGTKTFYAYLSTGAFKLSTNTPDCYLIDYYLGSDGKYHYATHTYRLD